MKTHSTLGPFTTLILMSTVSEERVADVTNPSPEGVVKSLLFARFVTDILSTRARRNAGCGPRVFRIGSEREFDAVC